MLSKSNPIAGGCLRKARESTSAIHARPRSCGRRGRRKCRRVSRVGRGYAHRVETAPITLPINLASRRIVLAREASLVDGAAPAALELDLEEPHACVDESGRSYTPQRRPRKVGRCLITSKGGARW